MRMYSASGRSRWPLVIIGGVAAVAIIGGVAYGTIGRDEPAAAPTTQPTPTPTPSSTGSSGAGDGEAGAAPTGCLGGNNRDVNMVLAAQAEAPHTAFGAIEVATSYYRFFWQNPFPSSEQLDQVSAEVVGSDAPDAFRDLSGDVAAAGDDPTAGVVPPGTPFYMSTTNGLWVVLEGSTADRVTVSLAAGYVIDGALSATEAGVAAFVMVWEDDAWHIERAVTPDQDALEAGGTRYTGGC
jgi:hypothetical protein